MKFSSTVLFLSVSPSTVFAKVSQGLIRSFATGMCWQTDSDVLDQPDVGSTTEAKTHFRPRACDMNEPKQLFEYDDDPSSLHIKIQGHTKCLDGNTSYDHLFVWTCGSNAANHRWSFTEGDGSALANGILKSGQNVCAATDVAQGADQITHADCATVKEHFQFIKLEVNQVTGKLEAEGGGGIQPVSAEQKTDAGTGVSVPLAQPLPEPEPEPKPVTSSTNGDPHFKTWGGDKYDFHGGCDLVLISNPDFGKGIGLNIHIRTKLSSWWSSVEAAVVQIGDQMLEFQGGANGEGPNYWVNGLKGEDDIENDQNVEVFRAALETQFGGFQLSYKEISAKQHRFRIDFNTGDAISLESYKDWVSVNTKVNPDSGNFDGSVGGLMGAFPTGEMLLRDGETVAESPVAFGKEWQVRESEGMLFHSAEGPQYPVECTIPEEKTLEQHQQRRLGEALVTQEDAEQACARAGNENFELCVFDVLASNDKDMAGAY